MLNGASLDGSRQKCVCEVETPFTVATILVHFRRETPTVIETDASDFALAAVLSRIQETKWLHPVAYHSRKFMPAEINYDAHNKEATCYRDGV
jgi:hypothetical protein